VKYPDYEGTAATRWVEVGSIPSHWDQLFFDQIQEEAIESETLREAAATNSKSDFRYVFEKAFEGLVIDRMEGNEEIFGKLMSDGEFRKLAVEHLLHQVYSALKIHKP